MYRKSCKKSKFKLTFCQIPVFCYECLLEMMQWAQEIVAGCWLLVAGF